MPLSYLQTSHPPPPLTPDLRFLGTAAGGGHGNLPGSDYVQRTPAGTTGALELQAMRALAQRPDASLEIMEWSILNNELGQP